MNEFVVPLHENAISNPQRFREQFSSMKRPRTPQKVKKKKHLHTTINDHVMKIKKKTTTATTKIDCK